MFLETEVKNIKQITCEKEEYLDKDVFLTCMIVHSCKNQIFHRNKESHKTLEMSHFGFLNAFLTLSTRSIGEKQQ